MSKKIGLCCSPISGRIFAGSISKDGMTFLSDKVDVTNEAVTASVHHLLGEDGSCEEVKSKKFEMGKSKYELRKIN